VSIGYDLRGNLTSQGASLYTYTVENRLVNGPSGAAFTYDPTGRLSQSSGASGTMQYQYDGTDLTAEYNTSGQLQRRYVHGPGADEPLVWYEGSGTTDRRWFHQDERGSIVALSNSSGAMIAIDSYDEYGIPASTNLGRFQYTGQTWMPEIGMYYYKARVYSPTLGRFLQTDPIGYGDGINWYAYVGNDPMDRTDPSGTYSCGSSLSESQCKDFTASQEAAKKQITATVGALKGIQSKIDSGKKLTSAEQKVADSVSKVLGKGAGTNSKALGNLIDKAGKIQGELNGSKPAEFGGENKFFSADAGNPTKLVLYQSFFSSSEKYQSQTVAHEGFHHGTGLKDIGQQTNNGDYIGPYGYQNAIRRADYYHNPLEAMRNPDAVTYALGFEDSP